MIALFDTNIALDILLQREEFFKNSFSSVIVAEYNKYQLAITSNAITDIYYIATKLKGKIEAKRIIEELFTLFDVFDINEIDCINACEMKQSRDFEDGVLIACAQRHKVECIITRNIKDFNINDIKVYTPEKFLKNHKMPW